VKVDLKGDWSLETALVELEKLTGKTTTGRNVLVRGGTAALAPMRDRMAQLAPHDPQDRDGDGNHLRDTMRTQAAKAGQMRALGMDRRSGVLLLTGPAPVGRRARANAGWQEDGTVKMQPNAYVRPAADSTSDKVIDELTGFIIGEIGKAKARIQRKAAKGK
jgi:hypothetical protein